MQPIDYVSGFGQNPMGGLMGAMEAGQRFGMMEQQQAAAREKQQMLMQQQQAESLRQQQIREATMALLSKPNRTMADYESLGLMLDKEGAASVRAFGEARTKEQDAAELKTYLPIFAALNKGKTDVAIRFLRESEEAYRNSGLEQEAKAAANWVRLAEEMPTEVDGILGARLMRTPEGRAAVKEALEQRRQPEIIQVLSALGLEPTVDNIARYEDAKRGEPTDVQLMRKLGLPVTPEGLSRLEESRNRGKGPLVTVQTPGQQLPPTPFEQAVDKKGADVYVAWKMEGGESNANARIAQLQDVVKKLETTPNLTGPGMQLIPEWARPLLKPDTVAARQNAERVIQEGMRAIMGAQFTQAESDAFMKRAFDPALGVDENARRLRLILQQMKTSARQAREVSDYVEKNRTLQGFRGTVPSLADFESAIAPRGGGVTVTAPNGQVLSFPNQQAADAFKKAAGIP